MYFKGDKSLEGKENTWTFSHGFNMMVDFCIYVLLVDGVRVSPFDIHAEGNKMLRMRGFTANDWHSWLAEVVALQDQQRATAYHRYDPPSIWKGSSSVRDALSELWRIYEPLSNERREWEARLGMKWTQELPTLWHDLKRYQRQLDTLTIYLVGYPKAVDYLVPPTSGIMTVVDGQLESSDFYDRMLYIADSLAAESGREQKLTDE